MDTDMDNLTGFGYDNLFLFNGPLQNAPSIDSYNEYMHERRAFHITLLTLTITFNLALLLYCVKKKHNCLSDSNRSFILHVAVTDILYACFVIAPLLKWEFTNDHNIGDFFCKCLLYLQETFTTVCPFILSAMSVYSLNTVEVLSAPSIYCSGLSYKPSLFGAWTMSILITIPVFIISNETLSDWNFSDKYHCQIHLLIDVHWQVYISVKAVVQFVIPFVIMTTCYSIIARKIWKRKQNQFILDKDTCHDTYHIHDLDVNTLPTESTFLKIAFTLFIFNTLVTAPYYIQELIDVHHELTPSQQLITQSTVILCLHQTPPLIFPLVYAAFLFHRKPCNYMGQNKKPHLLKCTSDSEKHCINIRLSGEICSNPGSEIQSCKTTLDDINTEQDV